MRHSFLVLAAAAVALARPLNAQNQTLEIVRLAEGVHAAIRSEFRMDPIESNSLVVIGPDDVMVVDTGRTPHTARRIIGEIRKLTDRPVRLVVNSHWHDDHVFGNQAFEEAFPGVHFIAHRQTRLEMISRSIPSLKDYGLEYWSKMAERFEAQLAKGTRPDGSPLSEAQKTRLLDQARTVRDFLPKIEGQRIVLPTMEIESTVTIHQGKREIRLIHAGSGNTPGDVAVYLPQEKILATGDLLVHPVPFAYGSDIPAWVATLKTLRALDVDVIVPGHGPVMRDPQYLDLVIGLFQSLVDQVTAAKKAGLSLDETRKKLDVEPYRARMTGDDGFRRATFADSIVREAVERIYKAIAPAR
jgi:glyoxylase-like metal-dependent hydrolase (beta-lactamase superfamily II)